MVRSNNSKQRQRHHPEEEGGGTPAFTSSSQESNGASSSSESIQTKLGRAREIEDSLEALRTNNNEGAGDPTSTTTTKRNTSSSSSQENKSSSLRLQLCGILSDVILVDPAAAADVDAIGRMWKGCFYTRINDLRSRIIKEKSRAKRRREGGGADGGGGGGGGGGGDDSRRIADVEKQLSTFLNESVQLYDYIIGRYVEELTTPPPTTTQSQSQQSRKSEDHTDNDDDNDDDESNSRRRLVRIVVKSLHRMHIHLGDLHRYSSQYDAAEICYLRASRLAPGSGNAYNQLAVVAQTSSSSSNKGGGGNDMTVVALYYYARSLMSSCDIFETSRANLSRLYDNNRKWLEEHTRDNNNNDDDILPPPGRRRELIDPITGKTMTRTKKEEKELTLQRRTIANRKILSRFVDVQYDYIRGIATVEPSGRVDDMTDGLFIEGKAASLLTVFREAIIVNVSFSDTLLCKLVSICAYTTLGAGNDGKLISKNNGVDVSPDQALAFSFILRFCAMLAEDVDAVLAKRHSSVRLGNAIRSFTALLLGLRFALTFYDDVSSREWFHAISYFPTSNETSGKKGSGGAIRDICEKSHICFWSAIAQLANRLDAILANDQGLIDDDEGIKPVELVDVKDFDDYRGFIPFAPFLDTGDVVRSGKGRAKIYATADEAIRALAESSKSQGSSGSGTNKGGGGGDVSSTRTKINLFLSVVDGPMGLCVLRRNGETNEREIISRDEGNIDADFTPPSPYFTNFNVNDDAAMDCATSMMTAASAPLKSPYADIGVELLTPAALLAGSAIYSPAGSVAANNESTKLPLSSALSGPNLAWPSNVKLPPNPNMVPTRNMNSLLNISHVIQPNTMLKMPLPPPPGLLPPPGLSAPPGFSIPQQVHQQQPYPSNTGISLSELPALIQYEQTGGGMLSRAGPFETMNPFVQQQASLPLSFDQNYFTASNPPPGLNQQQQYVSNIGGFDPTLDFLLGDGLRSQQPTPDVMASSDHFNLLLPPSSVEDDQSESILNFLFNSNNDSSRSRQPLYATSQRSQHHDLPPTKNPFAT